MKEKQIYKILVYNEDRTFIYVIAKSKLDASCKYGEWLKVYGEAHGITEYTDFNIDFVGVAFE